MCSCVGDFSGDDCDSECSSEWSQKQIHSMHDLYNLICHVIEMGPAARAAGLVSSYSNWEMGGYHL